MKEKQSLYFIAVIPPGEICDAITKFKKDLADRFQSKAALRIIPHITLKAPFRSALSEHVIQWFQNIVVSVSSFQQQLMDFGAFQNRQRPVIYIKPVMNASLRALQKEVIQNFRDVYSDEQVMRTELDFNPHVTIAYRDLKPSIYKQAWSEYRSKQFTAMFEVKDFQLLQHDGRMWNSVSNFPLQVSIQ